MDFFGKTSKASLQHGIASILSGAFGVTSYYFDPVGGPSHEVLLLVSLFIVAYGVVSIVYSRSQADREEIERKEREARRMLGLG